jgi:hypothetical protein
MDIKKDSLFKKFSSCKLSAEYNKQLVGGVTKYTHEASTGRWDTITNFGTDSAVLDYTTQDRDAKSN